MGNLNNLETDFNTMILSLGVGERAVFAPPPFTLRSDRCNLSCSFL